MEYALPDQHYIEQIKKRMWSNQELGNVSVMVGAGFSLNGDRVSKNASKILTWGELMQKMLKDLYPEKEQNSWFSGSDALKLANEYETVFGRHMLDELIIKSIPDQSYVPGKLHKLLLSLPWSDVFTTNYDTLLERTRVHIHDKKYELIHTPSDLPGRAKPRIIKLHGSFPSHRPFIITEEDYRSYPNKFASFVNTVQQSIMENILCLIGFSGDDPNFLNWIGWVKDTLGQDTPPIYFCGFVNGAQRRTLEARGIIPIDFTPLFPEELYPGNIKYNKSLEWFLKNLEKGKKPGNHNWPAIKTESNKNNDNDLPPIPNGPAQLTPLGSRSPNEELDIKSIINKWRSIRLEYPGWVIAPKRSRDRLWEYSQNWVSPIMKSTTGSNSYDSLSILYELNWRLEISLTPWSFFVDNMDFLSTFLENIDPFADKGMSQHKEISKQEYDLTTVREFWIELSLCLLKYYREEFDEVNFKKWKLKLGPITDMNLEWKAKWFDEVCKYYLAHFDTSNLKRSLEEWPKTEELPYWEMRKASLLAEIGDLKEAERVAEQALMKIRFRQSANEIDYSLLSQEGWAMVILSIIKNNNFRINSVFTYYDRWKKLSVYHCNPWIEIEPTVLILKASHPHVQKPSKEKKGFDPGIIKHTYTWGLVPEEIRLSYGFLRMLENGGVPIRSGRVAFYTKEVENTAKWIKPYSPLLAISVAIRTGKGENIESWYDRTAVARADKEEVNSIYKLFKPAIQQSLIDYSNTKEIHNFYRTQLPNYIELISRFCFKFDEDQKKTIFNLAQNMYVSDLFRNSDSLYKPLRNLYKRLLDSFDDSEKLSIIVDLMSLPIPGENSFNANINWVEPFDYIGMIKELNSVQKNKAWSKWIGKLINDINNGDERTRQVAIIRINCIYSNDGLTKEESELYCNALWGKVDPGTELPANLPFLKGKLLELTGVKSEVALTKIREYLTETKFPNFIAISEVDGKKSVAYASGQGFINFTRELIFVSKSIYQREDETIINWHSSEAKKIFNNLQEWWEYHKEHIQRHTEKFSFFDETEDVVSSIMVVIIRVIAPYLDKEDKELLASFSALINDFEKYGVDATMILPVKSFLDFENEEIVEKKLLYALNSSEEELVDSSIFAICYWVFYETDEELPKSISRLLGNLISKVFFRKQPKLNVALYYIDKILTYKPEVLDEEKMDLLLSALDYLLEETSISNTQDYLISLEDRPKVRANASKLAYTMFVYYESKEDVPEILKKWKDVSSNEPLPEVRKNWS